MSQILIIDDQPANRDLLATLLGYYGHSVLQAGDGAEGLSIACRETPDLIISDVLMPAMDGYEFVRRLRQEPALASKPVIFYTAHYLEDEAFALARKCGVSYVLRKPCEPSEVIDVVHDALGSKPTRPAGSIEIAEDHLELITTRLSRTVDELTTANVRMRALIDAGQRLATERDPAVLVDEYARVAREIVGAGLSVIAVFDPDSGEWGHIGASGVSVCAAKEIVATWKQDHGCPCAQSCSERHSLVEIRTPNACLGWLCVADKAGGGTFSEDEEQLARTLAAQLAAAYSNVLLYAKSRRYTENLEARVRERARELEAAQQELEAFTYAVSHDLRAPLHNLNGLSFLLDERFGKKLEPEAGELVRRIHRASFRMADLVKSLLELSRISKQEIRVESVCLDNLLSEALNELEAESNGRTIEWTIRPLPQVQGSATLLKQVLTNLLSNAVKFTSKQERAAIEVGATHTSDEQVIYVKDNGVGFDPSNTGQLFKVFTRLHPQDAFPGHGAGLSIVQRIVTRHGGRIWAESEPGKGATFYFTLNGVK